MGAIDESYSNRNSPILLVPNPDESVCFWVDFHKVNTFLKFLAYPIPCVELLDQLGVPHFYSIMDFTKGYWQTPLSSR